MASTMSQMSLLQTQAEELVDRSNYAQNKKEAENFLESAAKLLMQALKLCSDQNEKGKIKQKCERVLDQLENTMAIKIWEPNISIASISTTSDRPGDFGHPIEPEASKIPEVSSESSMTSSNNTGADHHLRPARDPVERQSHQALTSPADLKSVADLGSQLTSMRLTERELNSRVIRLSDPVSARKTSTKEKLILWKASKLNGFNAPPWENPPEMSEFLPLSVGECFIDSLKLSLSEHQKQLFSEWMRIEKALPPPAWTFDSNIRAVPSMHQEKPVDLVQDAASDCSVVASLCAAAARSERGHPEILLKNLWPRSVDKSEPIISPNGKYVVRLNFNGHWRKVVIDDNLPVSKTSRLLHVIDRSNPTLVWPALLEKAYLKVRGGYDFPGSSSCSDLWAFTGWIPEQIYLHENDLIPAHFWKRLHTAFNYGDVLVTVGTGKLSKRSERYLGLESQHNYVIMDMRESEEDKLFLVKNPWLEGKGWRMGENSKVSDSSRETCTTGSQDSLVSEGYDNGKPLPRGYFWINLDNMMQHFESMFLSWNPGLFKHRQDIHFTWDIQEDLAGTSIIDHPQFSFKATRLGTIWLLLSRHFKDNNTKDQSITDPIDQSISEHDGASKSDEGTKGFTSIYIYSRNGRRAYVDEDHVERSPFVNSPQALLRWECVSDVSYTLVINQMELPPSTYGFSLSAFTEIPIELASAVHNNSQKISINSKWTASTSGGNIQSPNYILNPQFRLRVASKTSLVILIETPSDRLAVHAKLVHGRGQRVFSLQSRDVVVDTGNYRHGCAVAEHEGVEPGLYTIICSTFEQGQLANFRLTVESNTQCELMPIAREGAGLVSMKLSRALFGPQVSKLACPLRPSRLVGISVTAQSAEVKSYTQLTSYNSRSPLRVTVEIGRGPERRILMASSDGEYSDASTIRTEKVNLEPNFLLAGDIWLVLDRLTRPVDGSQELYDVELFCDAPNAVSAGVWREWDN